MGMKFVKKRSEIALSVIRNKYLLIFFWCSVLLVSTACRDDKTSNLQSINKKLSDELAGLKHALWYEDAFHRPLYWYISEDMSTYASFYVQNEKDKQGIISDLIIYPQNYKLNKVSFDAEVKEKEITFSELVYEIEFLRDSRYLCLNYNLGPFKLEFDEEKYISEYKDIHGDRTANIVFLFDRVFEKGHKISLEFPDTTMPILFYKNNAFSIAPLNIVIHSGYKRYRIGLSGSIKNSSNHSIVIPGLNDVEEKQSGFSTSIATDVLFYLNNTIIIEKQSEDQSLIISENLISKYKFNDLNKILDELDDIFGFSLDTDRFYFLKGMVSRTDYPVVLLNPGKNESNMLQKDLIHEIVHLYSTHLKISDRELVEGIPEFLSLHIMKKLYGKDFFKLLENDKTYVGTEIYQTGAIRVKELFSKDPEYFRKLSKNR